MTAAANDQGQTDDEGTDLSHDWVINAQVPVSHKIAKQADFRGSFRATEGMRIDALDVMCFTGDTEFLTRDGVRTFADCVGTTQLVLTQDFATEPGKRTRSRADGRWVEAAIETFGEQRLFELRLSRDRVEKTIRTTAEHLWFATRGDGGAQSTPRIVATVNLEVGMRLASLTPRDAVRQSTPSTFGIAHGVVFGDGNRMNQRGTTTGTGCRVDLFGEKDLQLLRYFNESPAVPFKNVNGVEGMRVTGLPGYFKNRPSLDESVPYLYGWLAGYFAADGSVDNNGCLTLSSASYGDLMFAKAVGDRIGMPSGPVRTHSRVGIRQDEASDLHAMSFYRSRVRSEFLLIDKHREAFLAAGDAGYDRVGWKIAAVTELDETDEVFCAVVPDTCSFALADYIWTHNCGGCRRHFEDVADEACAAKINNEHLRGGPIGERKKRKVFKNQGVVMPGPRIDRRGVEFLVGS